jgi:hypothetical protein
MTKALVPFGPDFLNTLLLQRIRNLVDGSL